MSLSHAALLGLLQGVTEFLPISSSGHLVLLPWLLGWPHPGLAFDTLVHWGTAVAVVGYFWRDWVALLQGIWWAARNRSLADPRARLAALILVGTVPAALIGWLLEGFFEQVFARPVTVAGFLMVTAGFLTIAEMTARKEGRTTLHLTWTGGLLIGLAQAVAILPGLSRSGATIAAGMGCGLKREEAAHFSFLLATPVILGAGLLQIADLLQANLLMAQTPALAVGFLAALISGLACIHFLLRYLRHRRLYPFALYCAGIGVTALAISLFTP